MKLNLRLKSILAVGAVCIAMSLSWERAVANVFSMPPGLTSLKFVPVGNPGNPSEPQEWDGVVQQFGSVPRAFEIGKYEVTSAQYVQFLNSVAKTDTYGLYNPGMWEDPFGCKIERHALVSGYSYSVAPDRANQPVNFVSFWDSLRFINWLHNKQPVGAQTTLTTETGAYTINGYNGDDGTWIVRNATARYWLPSENEWYKAAYYDPVAGHYWEYPTGSDTRPSNTLPDLGNNANYLVNIFNVANIYTVGDPYWRTDVGTFAKSDSPYGTYDQGGNVFEWNEKIVFPNSPFTMRGFRGGSWGNFGDGMMASVQYYPQYPNLEDYHSGFRVATFPEPAACVLIVAGLVIIPWRHRAAG